MLPDPAYSHEQRAVLLCACPPMPALGSPPWELEPPAPPTGPERLAAFEDALAQWHKGHAAHVDCVPLQRRPGNGRVKSPKPAGTDDEKFRASVRWPLMDWPGRVFTVNHAHWRLRHIAQARREVARRFAGADGDLSRRLAELDRLSALAAAEARYYVLLSPRLRLDYRLDAERDRLRAVIRETSAGEPSAETGQDFVDRLAAIAGVNER